jgi:hypothetical protein
MICFPKVFLSSPRARLIVLLDNSPGAPGKPSTDCAATVEALLADGLINVNISVQTWSATSGAPQGITGTYITYVMANGTLTGGNL